MVPDPDGPPPYDDDAEQGDSEELFESERNMAKLHDYLDLMQATDIEEQGTFDDDNQAVTFTLAIDDPPQQFRGFGSFVKDAWVDIYLMRDWSPDIRIKFRDRATEIMNTIGLHGVSLYFAPDEDALYMSHRVFSEGLNFDVFRACVWSLISAQSRVATILERAR
jgi:hypothetical protein